MKNPQKTFLDKVLWLPILGLLTSPCWAEIRTNNLWGLPECVTVNGRKIDDLFIFLTGLTFIVFIAVVTVMIYFMIKYRAQKGVKATYNHGNNTLEFWWTVIPAAIFIAIVVYSNGLWDEILDVKRIPKDALNIEIVAEQYGFNLRYPGPDNILGKSDELLYSNTNKLGLVLDDPRNKEGFTTYNEFFVPVGKAVHLHLRSRDVIHGFYIPEFRLYQDMVPGRRISWIWFQTTKTGNYAIACNQLCGTGHYNMQAKVKILSQEDFDKWVQSKTAAAQANNSSLPVASNPDPGALAAPRVAHN